MRIGLRARVALSLATLSLIVAGTVSATTYAFARWYLVDQRESAALTRAALDSRAVSAYLDAGAAPVDALAQIPTVGTSQTLIQVDSTWYTAAVTVPPDALPPELLAAAVPTGAHERFVFAGAPYYAVAIPTTGAMFVELFPLRDLDRILTWGGWILVGLSSLAALLGALIGASAARRILGPVRRLGDAARRVADGDLATRIALTGDPDLDPIASSFNEMAEAVEVRIDRERRFSANVSHELRSPLTSVLGTAELLEGSRDHLPEREAGLATVLAQQVRRMSRMLLDLLEISRIGTEENPQWESADIAAVCRDVCGQRGLDPDVVVGDRPVVRTDARRLERIVGNLIDNATRHAGGVHQVLVRADAGHLVVVVDDAGPGIEPGFRDRLFEPFARGDTSGATPGAGLGLAIVHDQTVALGGEVTVGTSPSGGARFTVTLPVTPAAAPALAAERP